MNVRFSPISSNHKTISGTFQHVSPKCLSYPKGSIGHAAGIHMHIYQREATCPLRTLQTSDPSVKLNHSLQRNKITAQVQLIYAFYAPLKKITTSD